MAVAHVAAVGRAVAATAVEQHEARLRLHLRRLRRTPRRIFLPTRMRCLFPLRHPHGVVAAAVVVEAVALETMRQQ